MTLRHAWVLPLAPTAAVLLIAVALMPVTTAGPESLWLLGLLTTAALLATVIATAAGHVSGEPTEKPRIIAAGTAILTAATPFVVAGILGGPTNPLVVVPWLIFGLGAGYWQLQLCEGARSRPLHAVIGFSYTLVFTAVTLLFVALSARVVD